jgi:hypothetical protein
MAKHPSPRHQAATFLNLLAGAYAVVGIGDASLAEFRAWLDVEHPDWPDAMIEVEMQPDISTSIQRGTLRLWHDQIGWRVEREIKAVADPRRR